MSNHSSPGCTSRNRTRMVGNAVPSPPVDRGPGAPDTRRVGTRGRPPRSGDRREARPAGGAERPAGLRASSIEVGRGRYVLLSFSRARVAADGLTHSEREVALAVLGGLSNAEIA